MAEPTELIIEAGRTEQQYWRDLLRYRELFYFLSWRDVLVRYKQTAIGIVWALLRPLLTTLIFVFVVRLVKSPTEGVPPAVYILAALLPWQLFASSLSEGSASLITNTNLISKVYFPRLIVPASAVIVSFVDFVITLALTMIVTAIYRITPGWSLLALPLFTLLVLLPSVGAGLWLAALNVKYRDFRYVVPFIVQLGIYVTPVFYGSLIVPERWRLLYACNPLVGAIAGFRWSLTGGSTALPLMELGLSLAAGILLLAIGVWFFRRTERSFADLI